MTKNIGAYYGWSQSFDPQDQVLLSPKPVDPATGLPVVGSTNGIYAAQPLTGEGHDLGFKVNLFDRKLNLTASYYDVRQADVIQSRTIVNPANGLTVDTYSVQSGAEWSQGVEFGVVGSPLPGVDVLIDYNQPFSGFLLSDASTPAYVGKELENNPKEQLSFFVKYTREQGWLKGAYAGLGGRYWGDSQADGPTSTQLATTPPYFIMNALVGYRWKLGQGLYSVQLNVPNFLDRHVLYSGYAYSGSTTYRLTLGAKF